MQSNNYKIKLNFNIKHVKKVNKKNNLSSNFFYLWSKNNTKYKFFFNKYYLFYLLKFFTFLFYSFNSVKNYSLNLNPYFYLNSFYLY